MFRKHQDFEIVNFFYMDLDTLVTLFPIIYLNEANLILYYKIKRKIRF